MSTVPAIRPAAPDDVPHLDRMIRGLAEFERLLDAVTATETDLREALFGPRPVAEALVADDAGVPVGFALFFTTYSTFVGRPGLYVEDVYVEPAHRGRGIGRGLLLEVVRLARERGCGRVEWAALDWNAPAIRLYERLGARAMDEWRLFRLSAEALARLAP